MIKLDQLTPSNNEEVSLDMGDGLTVLVRWLPNEPEWLDLMMIASSQRGKGHASRALRQLFDFADSRGLKIGLYARMCDFDGQGLDTRQLADWYGRYGFETSQAYLPPEHLMSDPDHCGVDMWRNPQPLSLAA